jgi:hypothetical protein
MRKEQFHFPLECCDEMKVPIQTLGQEEDARGIGAI